MFWCLGRFQFMVVDNTVFTVNDARLDFLSEGTGNRVSCINVYNLFVVMIFFYPVPLFKQLPSLYELFYYLVVCCFYFFLLSTSFLFIFPVFFLTKHILYWFDVFWSPLPSPNIIVINDVDYAIHTLLCVGGNQQSPEQTEITEVFQGCGYCWTGRLSVIHWLLPDMNIHIPDWLYSIG